MPYSLSSLRAIAAFAFALLLSDASAADNIDLPLAYHSGGGNFGTFETPATLERQYTVINGIGAKLSSMDSYGWRKKDGSPNPASFDNAVFQSYQHGIMPVLFFEYYGNYVHLNPPVTIGSYGNWYAVGKAFAARFAPGGSFAREHGIGDWGVTMFSAINEPDIQNTIDKKAYHDALAGLADGVHSVNPALRVFPGGFATCNSAMDFTLRGYGPAIADLLNDGRLDGIDLHTYYHVQWFPIAKGRTFSAQNCFDKVKQAAHITRDIHFYATEFNFARSGINKAPMPESEAAKGFLTGMWDNLGVVGADGRTPVGVLAFPWGLFDTPKTEYALSLTRAPWTPSERGKLFKLVILVAGDMRFTELDPRVKGEFVLSGSGKTLRVWQDIPGWTDHPGSSITLEVPPGATQLRTIAFDGLRQTQPVIGLKTVAINGLPGSETYMFLFQ
jgi:hypothetical protein